MSLLSEEVFYDMSLFNGNPIVKVPSSNCKAKDVLKRLDFQPIGLNQDDLNPCTDKELAHVDQLLDCPFVRHTDNTELRTKPDNYVLVFQDMNVSALSPWEFRRENNIFLICLSQYLKIFDALNMSEINTDTKKEARFLNEMSVKNLLSLTCVCMSIICLLVTIVLFALRSEFHSLPGYNTLILCIFLLLAQTIYQFGVGQTSLSNWTCAIVGIICHILWLCVMFSMNACSVDMFLIFRGIKLIRHKYIGIRLIKGLTFIFSLSIFFVLVNIVVSLSVSRGDVIGYGGIICYISSRVMKL